ncbi:nuclease-related domain-containing protein [Denitrificimonas caeni]|uniref:nuclease-related domain-containing protein n=1 Tax=Denitrificimonas caeni TaxID=521720 RepID=UPI001964D113|nr:nuclease-related domain-containing protein [Denitrificimonas caeni]
MSILLFGQKAERTHENHMLRAFIQVLKADWKYTDKDLVLIANSRWNGSEIDLVCILPSSVLLIDFKDFKGHLIATENGPWMMSGIEVKGGSKENPYQQLRAYKNSIMSWFRNNNLLDGRNISHTNAAVVFTGPATGKPNLSGAITRWFHTADFDSCSALLADLASPALSIDRNDIDDIISALGVRKIHEDYGQDNRASAPISKPRPAVAIPPYSSVKVLKAAPKKQQETIADIVPARKRRLSGIFKSVAVVGGIFLTMAAVSQIYPVIGQSSTIPADESIQQVESNKSVVNNRQTQSSRTAATIQKTVDTSIETRSASNYLGQEITACGTVAQYMPFQKGAYLNFDRPYPQQTLTLVLWEQMLGSIESKLGRVTDLVGMDLCAHGYIESDNKGLQMQIASASAVQLK